MGCNSSKADDIQRDRERVRRPTAANTNTSTSTITATNRSGSTAATGSSNLAPSSSDPATLSSSYKGGGTSSVAQPTPSFLTSLGDVPRTGAQIIGTPLTPSDALPQATDEPVYGTSYTNRKTREYELLHEIVKQTRSNFIDVSRKPSTIDEDDFHERSQLYQRQLYEYTSTIQANALAHAASTAAASAAATASTTAGPSSSSMLAAYASAPSLFELPVAVAVDPASSSSSSSANASPGSLPWLLASLHPSALPQTHELEWIAMRAIDLTNALHAMRPLDTGKLVLSFDEL